MNKIIEKLIELQKIDSQIFALKKQVKEKSEGLNVFSVQIENKNTQIKGFEEELKQIQVKHKEKELDLQVKEESVVKQQVKLPQVKTNKEYNALLLEIEKMKADNSVLEEDVLKGFDRIDEFSFKIKKEKQDTNKQQEIFKQEKIFLEKEIKLLNSQIDDLILKKKSLIDSGIDAEALSLYEKILENKINLAIVPVINNCCQGCFMAVRPQTLNEIKIGKLVTCEYCVRILYLASDESE